MKRVKFTLEFIFRASPAILYKFIKDPSCIVRWFCDEVDITGETYTFSWEGSDESADLVDDFEEEKLVFKWHDADDDDEFLEFAFSRSPVTGETIFEITDFCDEFDLNDQKQLWESQIKVLRQETGG